MSTVGWLTRTAGLQLVLGVLGISTLWAQPVSTPTLDPEKALTQYLYDRWQTDEGLPQNTVNAIAQTPDGYLWLGTEEGLVRFDGVRFTVFDKTNTPALGRSQAVKLLFVDRRGALWIAPRGGGLVGLEQHRFTRYSSENGWLDAPVSAIYEDRDGALWIGTYGEGLFHRKQNRLISLTEKDGLSSAFITDVRRDAHGSLWVGTDRGLNRLEDGRVTVYGTAEGLSDSFVNTLYVDRTGALWVGTRAGLDRLSSGRFVPYAGENGRDVGAVLSLREDREGTLWLGLGGSGLARLRSDQVETFPDSHDLASGRVFALYEGREGSLWIGTEGGGLARVRDGKFTLYTTAEGLSHDMVLSITEGADGSMWIGTEGGGLNRLQDGRITAYTARQGLESDIIASVYSDRHGDVWVGTLGGGLSRWHEGRISTYTVQDGLPSNAVFALYEDRQGMLWIGTDAGLTRYDGRRFVTYTQEDGLSGNRITAIHQDQRGDLWVGTYDAGLNRLRGGTFTAYGTEDGLGSDIVLTLYGDEDGVLWVGTYEGGLSRFEDGAFTTFTTREGLFSDNLYQILEDGRGHLWMSSNKGLFRVDKQELAAVAEGKAAALTSHTYGRAEGLRNAELNGGFQPAGWRSRDGRLWFPTVHGVAVIDPARERRNSLPPPVHVEAVHVDQELLPASAAAELAPGKRKIEFHYAALSLVAPEKVRYRYQLEGYDEAWVDAGASRSATYTNLDPGRYTFRVMASNNDGVWNEAGASFAFYLKPFFYQTPLFWVLCLLGFLLISGAGYRLRISRLKARQRELEQIVAARTHDLQTAKDKIEAQANTLRELDRFKTRFFANVSHEFRTPLTLITGPLENVLHGSYGSLDAGLRNQMQAMLRNALRLLRLINQLLDLSKLESGKMGLRARPRNVVQLLEGVVYSFSTFTEQEGIALEFRADREAISLYYEPDKLEKVFYNLLSNAVKFTPAGGTIQVSITEKPSGSAEGVVEVRVSDTGPGIPAQHLPYIFDRFHQADDSNTREHEGTGIGLALVKELILLHGGSIDVESEAGRGTTFIVTLRKGKDHLRREDLAEAEVAELEAEITERDEVEPAHGAMLEMASADFNYMQQEDRVLEAGGAAVPEGPAAPEDAPLILIVDDNPDIRDYVSTSLCGRYRVAEARDGEEGLAQAHELEPDLIIADVMMPKMDGYQLSARIKTDAALDHIPVILLTAKASQSALIEGLEHGADEYMAKPFNQRELLARVSNLVQLREQERELKSLNADLEQRVQEQLELILRERRAYEARLLSEKDRAEEAARLKSSILNNMSHEFRTPMAVMLGYAEMLASEVPLAHQEFAQCIMDSGKRLMKTLDAVLDLARLESTRVRTQKTPLILQEEVEQVAAEFRPAAHRKDLTLRVDVPDEEVLAFLDRPALARVLSILLDNAVKFTETGEVRIQVRRAEDVVCLSIQDTGIGISRSFLPRLFDAFEQESTGDARDYEGSGLSLSVAKRLVELMGGSISVESEKGEGSVFTLCFPGVRAEYAASGDGADHL